MSLLMTPQFFSRPNELPLSLSLSLIFQVLDLSFNRIRKLTEGSFQRYTDVKFLLLYENLILSVEPGAFAPLTSLQVGRIIDKCYDAINRLINRLTGNRSIEQWTDHNSWGTAAAAATA